MVHASDDKMVLLLPSSIIKDETSSQTLGLKVAQQKWASSKGPASIIISHCDQQAHIIIKQSVVVRRGDIIKKDDQEERRGDNRKIIDPGGEESKLDPKDHQNDNRLQ